MVELRNATPADVRAIAAVNVASWRAAYRGLVPDDVLSGLCVPDRERFWSDTLSAQEPRTSVVVATAAPAVVGFAAAEPPLVPVDRADPTLGNLYALYLDPDCWGCGIGTQLRATVLDRLRACGFTFAGLWVLDGNQRALRFYLRQGWTDTGRTQVDRGPGGIELHERRLHRTLIS
jgi:ribosomal protein S18 acetylase RimI-like enzyme